MDNFIEFLGWWALGCGVLIVILLAVAGVVSLLHRDRDPRGRIK